MAVKKQTKKCSEKTNKKVTRGVRYIRVTKKWSGLRGSNPPPPPWQGGALPNELNPQENIFLKVFGSVRGESRAPKARIIGFMPTDKSETLINFKNGDSDGARTHDL